MGVKKERFCDYEPHKERSALRSGKSNVETGKLERIIK